MGSEPKRLFVDTSGLYELIVEQAALHEQTLGIFRNYALRPKVCLVTNFVLQEAATLFKARGASNLVPNLFRLVRESRAIDFRWIAEEQFEETFQFFTHHGDKAWSFVDCSCFVVMKAEAISDALTTDHHFRQAGFVPLLS